VKGRTVLPVLLSAGFGSSVPAVPGCGTTACPRPFSGTRWSGRDEAVPKFGEEVHPGIRVEGEDGAGRILRVTDLHAAVRIPYLDAVAADAGTGAPPGATGGLPLVLTIAVMYTYMYKIMYIFEKLHALMERGVIT
jgi:hypothetical protein